jgi:GNAT superfamily N-acetyltransferase
MAAMNPTLTPPEILALYDAQMRADPAPEPAVALMRAGPVLRGLGPWNMVLWSDLTEATADAAIAGEIAFFKGLGEKVEWKVYGQDGPADLAQRLAAAGFVADPPETVMAYDLAAGLPAAVETDGVEVRRVSNVQGIRDLVTAGGLAFGHEETWRVEALTPYLQDPSIGLYVAYVAGAPVASARLEMPAGRDFAGLWGGGVAPGERGRGIYRALVAVRAAEAQAKGRRFLFCDARATSRPILERLGFVALTKLTGWILEV